MSAVVLMADRLYAAEADANLPHATRALIEWLREEQREASTQWGGASGLWHGAFEVNINESGITKLSQIRATRHSIVHTAGAVTRSYRKSAKARLMAAGLDPARASGLIPIEAHDVDDAFDVSRQFVLWLDKKP